MEKVTWTDDLGTTVIIENLLEDPNCPIYKLACTKRNEIIETLADYDDEVADKYLSGEDLSAIELQQSLRKTLHQFSDKICLTFLGSAQKNRGLQPLMNGVLLYQPSPQDRIENTVLATQPQKVLLKTELANKSQVSYAFKVINDVNHGQIVYTRVYSGEILKKQEFYNSNKMINEKCTGQLRVQADEYKSVDKIGFGDIIGITGFKMTRSGDTLLGKNDKRDLLQDQAKIPPPVFQSSLELNSTKDKESLSEALELLQIEDTSFEWEQDEETGQIVVKGFGELHQEIIKNRIFDEYGIVTKLSKMRVALRETLGSVNSVRETILKMMRGKNQFFEVELEIGPSKDVSGGVSGLSGQNALSSDDEDDEFVIKFKNGNSVVFEFLEDQVSFSYYKEFRKRMLIKKKSSTIQTLSTSSKDKKKARGDFAQNDESEKSVDDIDFSTPAFNPTKPVEIGVIDEESDATSAFDLKSLEFELVYELEQVLSNSFFRGPSLGQPMHNVCINVKGGRYSKTKTGAIGIGMCQNQAVLNCLSRCTPILMEPVMKIVISCPNEFTQEIIGDLNKRGGRVNEFDDLSDDSSVKSKGDRVVTQITGKVPLANIIGYSSWIRGETRGEAHFILEFQGYDAVPNHRADEMLKNVFN